MNRKYFVIIGSICFGLGVIVGYLISGYPTLRTILNLVPPAVAILLLSVIISLIREEHNKKDEKKRCHSTKLVDKKLKSIANTHVSSGNGSLELYINEQKSSGETYENYSKEIEKHLEKGYQEICAHKIECTSIIDNHNNLARLFLDTTKEKILKEINERNLSLIEWNLEEPAPTNYFIPEYLFDDVEKIIQSSYKQFYDIERYCVINVNDTDLTSNNNSNDLLVNTLIEHYPEHYKWKLKINHHFAEGDIDDIKTLKQIIKETVEGALKHDDFNTLNEYKKGAVTEYDLYLNGINGIIKHVENGSSLKGKCEICMEY